MRQLRASVGTATERMDLLTVVLHEMGHILGLENLVSGPSDELMTALLEPGTQRLPSVMELAQVFSEEEQV